MNTHNYTKINKYTHTYIHSTHERKNQLEKKNTASNTYPLPPPPYLSPPSKTKKKKGRAKHSSAKPSAPLL